MTFPDKLDVLTVHATLIAETGGTGGLRDEALLESALAAAENRHRYEAADVVTCAATDAYHLTQTHAFVDGNKRAPIFCKISYLSSCWSATFVPSLTRDHQGELGLPLI